jgi:hypothetical protein
VVTLDRLVNVLGGYGVRLRFCAVPRSHRTAQRGDARGRARPRGRRCSWPSVLIRRKTRCGGRWPRTVAVLIRDGEGTPFVGEDEPMRDRWPAHR